MFDKWTGKDKPEGDGNDTKGLPKSKADLDEMLKAEGQKSANAVRNSEYGGITAQGYRDLLQKANADRDVANARVSGIELLLQKFSNYAASLVNEGRYDEAIPFYQAVISKATDPKDEKVVEARVQLGRALLLKGDYQESVRVFKELKDNPIAASTAELYQGIAQAADEAEIADWLSSLDAEQFKAMPNAAQIVKDALHVYDATQGGTEKVMVGILASKLSESLGKEYWSNLDADKARLYSGIAVLRTASEEESVDLGVLTETENEDVKKLLPELAIQHRYMAVKMQMEGNSEAAQRYKANAAKLDPSKGDNDYLWKPFDEIAIAQIREENHLLMRAENIWDWLEECLRAEIDSYQKLQQENNWMIIQQKADSKQEMT